MKFTLGWLRDHLDTTADVPAIVATLTRIGLEVEGVDDPAAKLAAFRIARVLSAVPHPQADKLQVLSVDAGDGPTQVVCGAPNARAGLVGVFGAPGAVVPATSMELRVATIRGVTSHGMMCSSRELELGDDHDGIMELPGDAPVGATYAAWVGLNDPVIDVAITPNRQDCMSVRGIARDLAAAGLGALRPLVVPDVAASFACPVEVRINDPASCPAFYGRVVRGLHNGTTPDRIAGRLRAIGQRSISAIVDITNYVMFDLGRPSHAYDLATLHGAVVARRARAGEEVAALNGKRYALTPAMAVIADDTGAHDIAGIMGGEASGVTPDTTDILLEVAYFTPEAIAATGQALALTSDARARFERGVDPAFLDDGMAILTGLILAHCGGAASAVVRAGAPPLTPRIIAFDPQRVTTLAGIDVAADEQRAILTRLGFDVRDDWRVTVPSWRRDVDGSADLVEEVVRIVGLDAIASVPLPRAPGVAKPTATPAQRIERRVRRAAAARGLHEAVTWSFIAEAAADSFGGAAWRVVNPISDELRAMRPSLLPGLMDAARHNLARGSTSVRLFEIGRIYPGEREPLGVGVLLAGERDGRHWATGKARRFDAFDAKAEALALLDAAGAPAASLQVGDEAGAAYHPGQSATLRLGPKTVLARFGMLHPLTARAFDIDGTVAVVEVDLDAIPTRRASGTMREAFAPPALQAVRRDFAFVVPEDLAAEALVRAVRAADKRAITGVRVFDRFAGIGDGQVSLALEVTLQPAMQSFTDAELAAISAAIVAAAAKLGATLRG